MPVYLKEITKRKDMSKNQMYSPELRTFALTLQFYSSKAYKYVRRVWDNLLPAPSTIRAWCKVVDGQPGFTQESFHVLKLRAEKENIKIPVTLVIDEMAIKRGFAFKNNRQYGQVNLGCDLLQEDGDNLSEAKDALVFMAVSLKYGWKIPIAYFLISSLSGAERSNLIKICLNLLQEANVDVCAITFDGAPTNLSMVTELGAVLRYGENFQPWFINPVSKKKVYVILDPSHMLKLTRNALAETPYLVDEEGNLLKWSYISSLLQLQEKEHLSAATKLTKKHVHAPVDNKMNVRLAAKH